MKIQHFAENVTIQINGVDISVPASVEYVTINRHGTLEGWPGYSIPTFFEGYWEGVAGVYLGSVELECEDVWSSVFHVETNGWLEDIWGIG